MMEDDGSHIFAARALGPQRRRRIFRRLFCGGLVIGDVMSRVIVFGFRLGRSKRPAGWLSSICRVAFTGAVLLGGRTVFAASAEPTKPRSIDAFYEPFRVKEAALAPDGQHVAFAVRSAR